MIQTASQRAVLVWVVLVGATLVTAGIAASMEAGDARLQTSTILGIAVVKVRLIGHAFMGLDHAPKVLVRLFDAWCAMVLAGSIGIYLIA